MRKNFGHKKKRQRVIAMYRAGYSVNEIMKLLELSERFVRKTTRCA